MSSKIVEKETRQICTRCVMDRSATGIQFDESGVCNYCRDFVDRSSELLDEKPELRKERLFKFVDQVKKSGEGKSYDCIVGISGGVDSSWALVKVIELGLRPLAVHMDNGWNSELAQNNIANLINTLGVDLYTYVIDWDEYRDLMQAFFDANVIDVELLYDNAMLAVNYQMAEQQKVKYILTGHNQSTEGMHIPSGWNWYKKDKKNIKAIAKRFGGVKIKSFPAISTFDYLRYDRISKIKWISFLDYVDYQKEESLKQLEEHYGYKRYPYKHYESVFTRFYQGYILPEKFGVDKRRVHLSTLIISGQMTREEALKTLKEIPYSSEEELEEDKRYFLKKMGWNEKELEDYIERENVDHAFYGTENDMVNKLSGLKSRFIR